MTTIGLLLSLFVVIIVGYVAGRTSAFNDESRRAISKFVFYIATSALIIQAIVGIDIRDLNKFPLFLTANAVILVLTYVAIYGVLKLARVPYKSGAAILYAGTTANTVFLGLPFIRVLYGDEGVLYAIAFITIPTAVFDIVAFYILSHWRHGHASVRTILSDFVRNPIVVATAVGLCLLPIVDYVPEPLLDGLGLIGDATTGCALFAMGVYLAGSSFRHFKAGTAAAATAVKLLIMPAATYGLARYVFGLQDVALAVTVLMAAFPSAIFCMIVATEYDFDERATADSILLSSVLFIPASIVIVSLLR